MGDEAPERAARIGRLESRPAGSDPEDPYDDVDVSELPTWWRRAVREFDAHGLRPYRPPRFEDDVVTYPLIADLESELGVDIRLGSVDSDYRERWEVWVDDAHVGEVGRHRSPEGYTVYELASDEFERRVRSAVDADE
ncbi:MAG: hypothetical protein ACQETI_00620 [Halobacteriota archaeon]